MMETLLPEMILKKRVGKTLHRECAIVYIFNHLAVEGSTDTLNMQIHDYRWRSLLSLMTTICEFDDN